MEVIYIYIQVYGVGELKVRAYKILPGLYIHRGVTAVRGEAHISTKSYWTLSHKGGKSVRNFSDCRLKDVEAWVLKYLAPLEWDKPEEELQNITGTEKELYQDAVYSSFPIREEALC